MLIVYDAPADVAYWIHVQQAFEKRPHFSVVQMTATTRVHIPRANVLNEDAVRQFAGFRDRVVRQMQGVIRYDD